jgi:CRP/FNR family transcriptional regulator
MLKSYLKKVYIFSNLNEDELEKLSKIVREKTFNKGDMIFFDTEPYLGFYIVISGIVKIYKISKDGKEHILHIVNPFNTFAEVPLFENFDEIIEDKFRYPANAMAIENNTKVILLPANSFKQFILNNASICIKMVSGFAKRLKHLNRHIEELTLKDVTKRVASFILSLNKSPHKHTDSVLLNINKNDLASYLGTIPETLSRTFKKLQDDELIIVEGKRIKILNYKKLQEISE